MLKWLLETHYFQGNPILINYFKLLNWWVCNNRGYYSGILLVAAATIEKLFFEITGPLSSKHRQMISKNPMFNGLSIPNQSQKSLKSLFPNLWVKIIFQIIEPPKKYIFSIVHFFVCFFRSDECLSFLKICLNLEPSTRTVRYYYFLLSLLCIFRSTKL